MKFGGSYLGDDPEPLTRPRTGLALAPVPSASDHTWPVDLLDIWNVALSRVQGERADAAGLAAHQPQRGLRHSPLATIYGHGHGHGRIADRGWAEPDLPHRRQPDNLASHVADAPSR